MHYVYILRLENDTFYTGYTNDLKRRLIDHKGGNTPHTKKFKPVELVYYSAFKNKTRALGFEKYLKSGSGIAFRNKRLI
ncbi:MAG: GIY-YIG nuclease family protein [Patescibacteria group bacterium]